MRIFFLCGSQVVQASFSLQWDALLLSSLFLNMKFDIF